MADRDIIDELLQAKVKSRLFGGDHAPKLGRLVILEPLGSGGMGTVFAAYDPRLERKVAVKLLRGRGASSERVLREARVLGKLDHPNVVRVFDATENDGVIAIVMELAPGETLRRYAAQRRTWRELLRVMQSVAEGLAAAHGAGVVHRDIKPDNIVIGPDRARLVDFGLACERGASDEAPHDRLDGAGTPAYMAPEVRAGGPANEASDQFSFGVTFFEALYGKRPHGDTTTSESAGAPGDPVAGAARAGGEVPRWLGRAIRRTLCADPAARFASMDALLRELGRDRRQRRKLLAVSLAGLALVAGGYVAGKTPAAPGDLCGGGQARVSNAWPPGSFERLRASLGDTPWDRKTVDDLADLTRAWEASHRRICEATRVHAGQPPSLLELRMRCLDRRFDRILAFSAALGRPLDTEARERANEGVAALPRPERCETLVDGAELALPDDPHAREQVLKAERDLDQAWAAYALGRYRDASDIRSRVAEDTKDLNAPAFGAQLALLDAAIDGRWNAPEAARHSLRKALHAAAETHQHSVELEVWIKRLKLELFDGQLVRVVEWAPFARAAAARAGRESTEIDGIEAEARRGSGDFTESRSLLVGALAKGGTLRGDQRALLEMNLGSVELAVGDPVAAQAAFGRAHVLAEQALGSDHPSLGLYLGKRAMAARDLGRMAEALSLHEQALALRRRAYGDSDRGVATTLVRRAETLIAAGKLALAVRDLEAARQSPWTKRLGEIDRALADAAAARGDRATAVELYRRARQSDPRQSLAAELARAGATVGLDELPTSGPLSLESARAASVTIVLLHDRGETASAAREAELLRERWGEAPPSAAVCNEIAAAHQHIGRTEQATKSYRAALAALADEPSRERLRALTGIADSSRDAAAAKAALAQLDAMPELDRSSRRRLEAIAKR